MKYRSDDPGRMGQLVSVVCAFLLAGLVGAGVITACSVTARSRAVDAITTMTTVAEYAGKTLEASSLPSGKKAEIGKDLDAGVGLLLVATEHLKSGGEPETAIGMVRTASCYVGRVVASLDVLLPKGVPPYIFNLIRSVTVVVGQCESKT